MPSPAVHNKCLTFLPNTHRNPEFCPYTNSPTCLSANLEHLILDEAVGDVAKTWEHNLEPRSASFGQSLTTGQTFFSPYTHGVAHRFGRMTEASHMVSQIKTVCLIGANGTVGSAIFSSLIDAGCFDVTVLRRSTSTSHISHADVVTVLTVSPAFELEELTSSLRGQHAVIAAFPVSDVDQHLRLAEAAARAGVSRYMPADFGSCDPSNPLAQESVDIYRHKMRIRDRCDELATLFTTFSWTSLVCGHLFDKDLREGYLRFYLDTCEAELFDSGTNRASCSTLSRIGQAVVRTIRDRLVETRNRALFIHSFNPTQLEILAALERVTGKTWQTRHVDSDDFLQRQRRELHDGNEAAAEEVIFVLGIRDADWSVRDDFANKLLAFEDENLDEVVAAAVNEHNIAKTRVLVNGQKEPKVESSDT